MELEDWVTNEILQTVVVTNLLVSITNFDSYCFTDFYIDFLLFRRPNYLYLLFLLYYYLCCFLDIFSLSSFLLFEIVIAALEIVDFERLLGHLDDETFHSFFIVVGERVVEVFLIGKIVY